jgi:predicted PurR-regulated permease PerM
MEQLEQLWRWPLARVGLVAVVVVALGAAVQAALALFGLAWGVVIQLESVLLLAGLSYLFAYLANPLVEWLETRLKTSRGFGVLLVFMLVVVFLGVASVLITSIITELIRFSQKLPGLVTTLQVTLNEQLASLEKMRGNSPELRSVIDQATQGIQTALSGITERLLAFLQGQGVSILSRTLGVVGSILQFVLVFIIGGYMLASYRAIGTTFLDLFPKGWRSMVSSLTNDISTAVGGYIRGQIIIATCVGTMVGIGLSIIGVPLALALGFIAGIFNIVPYLGAIIAITPALLLALPGGLLPMVGVVVVFLVANQIEAQVLSPNVLSKTTDLHPVTIVLAILTGTALVGVAGGLLAVPLAALGKLLIRKYWLGSLLHGGITALPPAVSETEENPVDEA